MRYKMKHTEQVPACLQDLPPPPSTDPGDSFVKFTPAVERGVRFAVADLEAMMREPRMTFADGKPVMTDAHTIALNTDIAAAARWLRYVLKRKRAQGGDATEEA